jgi:hypothetical protein
MTSPLLLEAILSSFNWSEKSGAGHVPYCSVRFIKTEPLYKLLDQGVAREVKYVHGK